MSRLPAALRSRLPPSIPAYLKWCFTVDTRSLAVFRIFVGILIIADVLSRARSFSFYYTDDGAVTQEVAELYTPEYAVSVFFFTSDPVAIAGLFILHALLAVVLIVGYKTRLMLALSFVMVISLDHHNPFVLSYADTLFRMLLFWALFLPLGERWSIDAIQRNREPRRAIANLATAAIMIQMVFMYFVNGLNKFPSELWHSGRAAIIVMGIDEMTFLLGNFMREFPLFLQIGGALWFHLLLASPFLIALYGRLRYPLILGLFGGHLSFAITVRIGAFPYVAILGLLTFLQPRFWRDARSVTTALNVQPHLDATARGFERSGQYLGARLPGRLIRFPGRDLLTRRAITLLVAIAMIGLLVFPAFSIAAEGPYLNESPLPDDNPVEGVADNWNVGQPTWSIFAGPGPRNIDRFFVFPAQTEDGQVFDIYNERPMTWERPTQEIQRQHSVYRERFFMSTIRSTGPHRGQPAQLYAEFLCEYWADERGVNITHINMWEVRERITVATVDTPEDRSRTERRLYQHGCGDEWSQSISPPSDS